MESKYDEKMTRRDFLILSGTFGGILLGGVALGAYIGAVGDNRKKTLMEKLNGETWSATGEKKVYDSYSHYAYKLKAIDSNQEPDVPTGYKLINSEPVLSIYNTSKLKAMKYYYVNTVPVIAEEYVNDNGIVDCPFPGIPYSLKKETAKSKSL